MLRYEPMFELNKPLMYPPAERISASENLPIQFPLQADDFGCDLVDARVDRRRRRHPETAIDPVATYRVCQDRASFRSMGV